MNRRSFLAAVVAAPLIARPSLEEIERVSWRRRLFPGWSPAATVFEIGDIVTVAGFSERYLVTAVAGSDAYIRRCKARPIISVGVAPMRLLRPVLVGRTLGVFTS